jgi:glycosyltransferase involved in cell wall biosynthesis
MESMTQTLTVIVLAKNEEIRIEACLTALSWVSERLVIDNGSTDDTVKRAKKSGATVIRNTTQDFGKLREIGADNATTAWILYIDADEIVTPELQAEIGRVLELGEKEAYWINRKNFYLGHPWPTSDRMIRLIRKKALIGWRGALHESAEIDGVVGELAQPLLHQSHRTLEEMVAKTNEWSEEEAKLRLAAQHPPMVAWRFVRVMATAFWNSFVTQGGWKAGTVGWIESMYQAFSMFVTYAKLWEMQEQVKNEK